MKKEVFVLEEAAADIEAGMDFYDLIEAGVGLYFRDSMVADIRRLGFYFGAHRIHLGFCRVLCSKFPYAIYYRDFEELRQIVAVLDLRREPEWIRNQLAAR